MCFATVFPELLQVTYPFHFSQPRVDSSPYQIGDPSALLQTSGGNGGVDNRLTLFVARIRSVLSNHRQPAHSSETMTAIAANSKGREQMLYILLGTSGLRFGEALGLEIDEHLSDDCSTLLIRQKVWNGCVQPFLKSENGIRICTQSGSVSTFA